MQFDSYTNLKTAILDFINRPDLTASVGGFVALAEAQMVRKLRRATGKATLTFTSGDYYKALSAYTAELRTIAPAVTVARPRGGKPLTQVSYEELLERRADSELGTPQYFAVVDSTVYVTPPPSDAYLVFDTTYFSKIVPLSGGNPSNAILAEAPDLYLYGALIEASPYLEHDERIPIWTARFEKAVDDYNDMRQREEFAASLKKARLPVTF